MKYKLIKIFFVFGIFGIFIACSTKKDRFLNRNWQALNTKYNVLYNGDVALAKGIEDLKAEYNDDFWTTLPVERMVVDKGAAAPGEKAENANFERAEEKATKAIQKRSMNIDGREVNFQMDEAHLLLGKARYYDLRFVPALEAFNYVLYKYPESDKIYEAKIWREKTNMRMENDAIAVINLRKLLREIKFKDQIYADANATLAQAFLNLAQKDSALAKLNVAIEYTKSDEEKARYHFIKGQILNEINKKDSAFVAFQSVIDMKRKSPRRYVIQAHLQQAKQFNPKTGDTVVFLQKFKDLLEDRENRPFLDFINHQIALYYDQQDNHKQAITYYNASLKAKAKDQYLVASNYRNLATLYFDDAKYPTAGKYYDSTLTVLDDKLREYKAIKKKRENLEDVIKFEAIAQANDSILNLVAMSKEQQVSYFDKYIQNLKEEEKKAAELAKKEQELKEIAEAGMMQDDLPSGLASKSNVVADVVFEPKSAESFYFYNPSTVSFGKNEFRKRWGKRNLSDNWRWSQGPRNNDSENDADKNQEAANTEKETASQEELTDDPRYTTDFYISKLPTKPEVLDSLAKDRNFAYYQLGVIYKEKFKEYELAADKLEKLLVLHPEERLVLPSMYNLFKIYQIINPAKAEGMKQKIAALYPTSRYAQIIANDGLSAEQKSQTPDAKYQSLYKKYEQSVNVALLDEVDEAIEVYTGEEIVPKLEFLKANISGRLKGVEEYKKSLNFVALNYPNSTEGKLAEKMLAKEIPYLEKLKFDGEKATSYKMIFKISDTISEGNKSIIEKIKQFTTERTAEKLYFSIDNYIMDEILLVMHGIPTEEKAKEIATILRDYKDFRIKETALIVSTENYKVIQVQKNLADYGKDLTVNELDEKTTENKAPQQERKAAEKQAPVDKTPVNLQETQKEKTTNDAVLPPK